MILNLAENPIVTHPIAPKPFQVRLQSLAEPARILIPGNPLIKIAQNLKLGLPAQLFELLAGRLVEAIGPIHA
jgi:hypothetical protein